MDLLEFKSAIGFLGMALIVAAWIPQTAETIRRRACPLPLPFILLYATGSLLLTVYALLLGDPVFTLLNGLALLQSLINLVVKLCERCSRSGRSP